MISKIANIGTKKSQGLSEKKRVKLLNQVVLVFVGGVFFQFLLHVFSKDRIEIIITLGVIVIAFLLTFILNYYGKVKIARIYVCIIFSTALTFVRLLYGFNSHVEFCFAPLIIMTVIFIDKDLHKILWIIFFSISYILSSYFLIHHDPIIVDFANRYIFYFMFGSCSLAVFLMSLVFVKENRRFEIRSQSLLDELKENNVQIEQANKELEKFAYVASHDLKTPLRNINSFLNLIQRKIDQGHTDEISEYLEFASLNAKRMHGLIQDILEFSQVKRENDFFEHNDLNEIVAKAISNLQDLIVEKNVTIKSQTLPYLFCNESQIISLFQNLLENGIKYNNNSRPNIKINYVDKPNKHEIYIIDNGIGIEKEYLTKVFEMFYRLHNQGEYPGTGIGLASCKKIATYHGGNIEITSRLGEGSSFCIFLPKNSQNETLQKTREISMV